MAHGGEGPEEEREFLGHRMPTKEEIRQKALELYYAEHPEAVGITPEDSELREGSYFLKAQRELMAGVRDEILKALQAYRDEMDRLIQTLEEMEEKVPEWARRPEELEVKIVKLEDRINFLRMKAEKATREAKLAEEKLKALEKVLAEKEAELAKKREIEKRYIYPMATVQILEETPAFTGADGKTYGPFKPLEIVTIPQQDAHRLIAQAKAKPWTVTVYKPPERAKLEIEELLERYIKAVRLKDWESVNETLDQISDALHAA